jgi:hypothetical protein
MRLRQARKAFRSWVQAAAHDLRKERVLAQGVHRKAAQEGMLTV